MRCRVVGRKAQRLTAQGSPSSRSRGGGRSAPAADGRTPARAALISCCTISRTASREGAELAAAGGCVEDDAVAGSVAGGGSWSGDAIRKGGKQDKRGNRKNFLCQATAVACCQNQTTRLALTKH